MRKKQLSGFTIVELLIVIVVIAILAAVTIVAYQGITQRATDSAVESKDTQSKRKLELYKVDNGSYPSDQSAFDTLIGQSPGDKHYTTYTSTSPYSAYTINTDKSNVSGGGGSGTLAMQTITTANCPTTPTVAVDARDNRTYWVQKLADNRCWMLTNLAYAGGGTNTYSDTKTITLSSSGTSYTEPRYYIPTNANPTANPTEPSTSTDGGATNPQYGYLYNWCAAMGAQTSTSACMNALTPAPDTAVSVCPAGWKLPTSNTGGEFAALTNNAAGSTILRSTWLAQYGGYWNGSFNIQGSVGLYWSATQYSSTVAYTLHFNSSRVYPSYVSYGKYSGLAVRCLAV